MAHILMSNGRFTELLLARLWANDNKWHKNMADFGDRKAQNL